jgi:hypothetical protein
MLEHSDTIIVPLPSKKSCQLFILKIIFSIFKIYLQPILGKWGHLKADTFSVEENVHLFLKVI